MSEADDPPDVGALVARFGCQPPPGVTMQLVWRVCARLWLDHGEPTSSPYGRPICGRCRHAWPCAGRRRADAGLRAAVATVIGAARTHRGGRAEAGLERDTLVGVTTDGDIRAYAEAAAMDVGQASSGSG